MPRTKTSDVARTVSAPDDIQGKQFALLLFAGVPPTDAIQLFLDFTDIQQLAATLDVWRKSKAVRNALRELQGGSWERKTTDEMMQDALEQHYRQLAYTMNNMHYMEASPQDRQKLDAAREAIEKKQAGTAGQGDGLTEFMNALRANKVKSLVPNALKVN